MLFFLLACSAEQQLEHKRSTTISAEATIDMAPQVIYSPSDVVTSIQDIELLKDLEASLSLWDTLPGNKSDKIKHNTNSDLLDSHEGFALLSHHLEERIKAIASEIERPLVVELKDALAYPAGNVGRAFDTRWLSSELGFFKLIGIVNRLDKKDFYPNQNCGEVRFIYRLGYQSKKNSSMLPMTLNVVYEEPWENCQKTASHWIRQDDLSLKDMGQNIFDLERGSFEVSNFFYFAM